MIFIKRAHETPRKNDGRRFLVDPSLPRGTTKKALQVERWVKSASPSGGLRKWFGDAPERWEEFQSRYFAELDQNPDAWKSLVEAAREGDITLVFSAPDPDHNYAVALRIYLIQHLKIRRGTQSRRAADNPASHTLAAA